jgi:hypothetical protein
MDKLTLPAEEQAVNKNKDIKVINKSFLMIPQYYLIIITYFKFYFDIIMRMLNI